MAYESGFASVYDVFTDEVNYEKRAEYILGLLKDTVSQKGQFLTLPAVREAFRSSF